MSIFLSSPGHDCNASRDVEMMDLDAEREAGTDQVHVPFHQSLKQLRGYISLSAKLES